MVKIRYARFWRFWPRIVVLSSLLAAVAFGILFTMPVGAQLAASIGETVGLPAQGQGQSQPSSMAGSTAVSSASASSSGNSMNAAAGGMTMSGTTGKGVYAALGDSVAAGLGLPPVASPTAQDTQCGRSSQAYPQAIARSKNLQLVFAACSGATAGDLTTQQHTSGINPQRQIKTAFAHGTPTLISVTAGANDVYWQEFIKKCYAATCGTSFDNATVSALLATVKVKLVFFLGSVQARSNGKPPTVILTGYYDPLSADCQAFTNNAVTANEVAWLQGSIDRLNQTIQQSAAGFSFATFVPVDFTGHDICSSTPWVQGLNDPAPIHPTQAGQQAIANAIIQAAP